MFFFLHLLKMFVNSLSFCRLSSLLLLLLFKQTFFVKLNKERKRCLLEFKNSSNKKEKHHLMFTLFTKEKKFPGNFKEDSRVHGNFFRKMTSPFFHLISPLSSSKKNGRQKYFVLNFQTCHILIDTLHTHTHHLLKTKQTNEWKKTVDNWKVNAFFVAKQNKKQCWKCQTKTAKNFPKTFKWLSFFSQSYTLLYMLHLLEILFCFLNFSLFFFCFWKLFFLVPKNKDIKWPANEKAAKIYFRFYLWFGWLNLFRKKQTKQTNRNQFSVKFFLANDNNQYE